MTPINRDKRKNQKMMRERIVSGKESACKRERTSSQIKKAKTEEK